MYMYVHIYTSMYLCISTYIYTHLGARSQLLPQKKKKTGFENRAAALQKLAGETRSDVDKQSCRFCGKIFSHPPARVQHERCCGRATPHAPGVEQRNASSPGVEQRNASSPGFEQRNASSGERCIYVSIYIYIYIYIYRSIYLFLYIYPCICIYRPAGPGGHAGGCKWDAAVCSVQPRPPLPRRVCPKLQRRQGPGGPEGGRSASASKGSNGGRQGPARRGRRCLGACAGKEGAGEAQGSACQGVAVT